MKNCKRNGGGFLAKIKSSAELQKARTAFLQYQDPKEYWIGIKYDTTKGDFVWGDGTLVTATTAFETIVNRVEQQSDTDKRCLYLSTQDVLVAADCEAHKKYICQVGETADPVETSELLVIIGHSNLFPLLVVFGLFCVPFVFFWLCIMLFFFFFSCFCFVIFVFVCCLCFAVFVVFSHIKLNFTISFRSTAQKDQKQNKKQDQNKISEIST